jgi:ribonucleotide reductase alpha subunit
MERSNSSKKVEKIKIIAKEVRKCGIMYREGSKGVQGEPFSPDF